MTSPKCYPGSWHHGWNAGLFIQPWGHLWHKRSLEEVTRKLWLIWSIIRTQDGWSWKLTPEWPGYPGWPGGPGCPGFPGTPGSPSNPGGPGNPCKAKRRFLKLLTQTNTEGFTTANVLASCYPSAFEAPRSSVPLPSWCTLDHDNTAIIPSFRKVKVKSKSLDNS